MKKWWLSSNIHWNIDICCTFIHIKIVRTRGMQVYTYNFIPFGTFLPFVLVLNRNENADSKFLIITWGLHFPPDLLYQCWLMACQRMVVPRGLDQGLPGDLWFICLFAVIVCVWMHVKLLLGCKWTCRIDG